MLERSLEILVRQCVCDIFGPDWELIAQQLMLPSGRIDLLFVDRKGTRHLVELKKGRATLSSIEQVVRYKNDLIAMVGDNAVVPWIVAHDIPASVIAAASQNEVKTRSLSIEACSELIKKNNLDATTLIGTRRSPGVLHGGSGKRGLRSSVPNPIAFAEMPVAVAEFLRKVENWDHFDVASGGMQTVIHYRGVKLGGVNRKHRGGHSYISEGVILTKMMESTLRNLGLHRCTKVQTHEHVWWEISWENVDSFKGALHAAQAIVDKSLRISQRLTK